MLSNGVLLETIRVSFAQALAPYASDSDLQNNHDRHNVMSIPETQN